MGVREGGGGGGEEEGEVVVVVVKRKRISTMFQEGRVRKGGGDEE